MTIYKENLMTLLSVIINDETEQTLHQMCEAHGKSEDAIILDAVRLYSYLELKVANGYRIQLVHTDSNRRLDVDLP